MHRETLNEQDSNEMGRADARDEGDAVRTPRSIFLDHFFLNFGMREMMKDEPDLNEDELQAA